RRRTLTAYARSCLPAGPRATPDAPDDAAPHALPLRDALPILREPHPFTIVGRGEDGHVHFVIRDLGDYTHRLTREATVGMHADRSEEHTSELQSREKRVCRPLLGKKRQTRPSRNRRRHRGATR